MKNKYKKIIEEVIWFVGAVWCMWLAINGAIFLTQTFQFTTQFPLIVIIITGIYLLYFHLVYKPTKD